MKKPILLLIWVMLLCLFPHWTSANTLRSFLYPVYKNNQWASIILDRLRGIYLIKPTSREVVFSASWYTTTGLMHTFWSDKVFINAGYFWRDERGFFPAGHVSLDPAIVDTTHCERDANLCGYIFTTNLTIHEQLTFTKEPTITAWPIMMHDGIVNQDLIKNISHRQRKTFRTILIQTKWWPVFVVTKKQYTLPWLLAYIVKHFGRNISVINLDGWSSTTLWTDHPLFQHTSNRRLPAYFVLE